LIAGPAGFAGLLRSVVGISDSVLTERLAELTKAGLVEGAVDDGPPISVEYSLTTAGKGLLPALNELTQWAADQPASRGRLTEPLAARDHGPR
jgi:DNA-binding HxlR family transcriptional regulator